MKCVETLIQIVTYIDDMVKLPDSAVLADVRAMAQETIDNLNSEIEEKAINGMKTGSKIKKMKVGDKVMWRGSWGSQPAREATIVRIEVCDYPGVKDGHEVRGVNAERKNFCVVDLDNGHWAYGTQIDLIE